MDDLVEDWGRPRPAEAFDRHGAVLSVIRDGAVIGGTILFWVLEFMLMYMVAFGCILIGFMRGNKKGARK